MIPARYLLWIDCAGALLAGIVVFVLSDWLSGLYRLPREAVVTIAAANFLYGCFSLSLACRAQRARAMIGFLALANAAWAMVCVAVAAIFWSEASIFGTSHLVLEGAYVAYLGWNEWLQREQLAKGHCSQLVHEKTAVSDHRQRGYSGSN